jgi:hypothetical protein
MYENRTTQGSSSVSAAQAIEPIGNVVANLRVAYERQRQMLENEIESRNEVIRNLREEIDNVRKICEASSTDFLPAEAPVRAPKIY